jgi:hypothetical protein
MRRRTIATVATFALIATIVVPSPVMAQEPAAPLTGEFLVAGPIDVTATCSQTGTSTISYSASGVAVGPYPGTFTEVGTVTIGQTETGGFSLGFPIKRVTSLEAFFTIDSAAGQVTGSKRLIIESDEVVGLCEDFTNYTPPGTGSIISGTYRRVCACPFGLSYEAIIETETGIFRDEGQSGLLIEELQLTAGGGVQEADVFNEAFSSSGIVELATVGKATGGGQIEPDVSFGLHAKSDGGVKGGCNVIDHERDIKVRCLDADSYAQVSNRAIFSGNAEVNGATTRYRIVVEDQGEPGRGVDRFSISTDSGYAASGALVAGNIQVHE